MLKFLLYSKFKNFLKYYLKDSKPNPIKALIATENTYKLLMKESPYLLKSLSPDSF